MDTPVFKDGKKTESYEQIEAFQNKFYDQRKEKTASFAGSVRASQDNNQIGGNPAQANQQQVSMFVQESNNQLSSQTVNNFDEFLDRFEDLFKRTISSAEDKEEDDFAPEYAQLVQVLREFVSRSKA